MLTLKEAEFVRKELETAKNPLFIHDSDGDGLASFLLLYRINREGKRLSPKGSVTKELLTKIEEINPDKIFILDKPVVDQEFVDAVKRPIFWIDHHEPIKLEKVHYYNPRLHDDGAYIPTTRMAWQISGKEEDLWIATLGCLADWYLPDFIDRFREKFPHLVGKKNDLTDIVFKQPVGKLVKMLFFLQKGPSTEVRKTLKVLTRIESPDEILKQETSRGKFLWKRFVGINNKYEVILQDARKHVTSSRLLLYRYTEQQWSFTTNLANELTQLYPKKVILIARHKGDRMVCSIRAHFPIVKALQDSIEGMDARGGGHPQSCGAVIKEEDWDIFLRNFKEAIKK